MVLLAGDVGGTKTLLGLFERGAPRPRAIVSRAYPTADYPNFTAILDAFAGDVAQPLAIEAVAVGVAGPVIRGRAALTNISWDISATEVTARFDTPRVRLLNDLAAMATSVARSRSLKTAIPPSLAGAVGWFNHLRRAQSAGGSASAKVPSRNP